MTAHYRFIVLLSAVLFAGRVAVPEQGPSGAEFKDCQDCPVMVGNNVMSMPAFGERPSAEEINLLARYLRDENGWQ